MANYRFNFPSCKVVLYKPAKQLYTTKHVPLSPLSIAILVKNKHEI